MIFFKYQLSATRMLLMLDIHFIPNFHICRSECNSLSPFSFGVIPTSPLPIHTPLMPNQSIEASLPINTIGPVMKMDPLNNLQVQEHVLSKKKKITVE